MTEPKVEKDQQARGAPAFVQMGHVTKSYGPTLALDEVSIEFAAGSVHALVGENGAGKSTLSKVLSGGVRPDQGTISVDGEDVEFRSPRQALALGIATILQEVSVTPSASALDNVFLGNYSSFGRLGLVGRRAMRARYEELVERVSMRVPADELVGNLRLADQQKVEIMRAVARDSQLIILDEPTAVLTRDEVASLKSVVIRLRDEGVAIVYISHFLDEVLELADTVSVLRDGRLICTRPAAEFDHDGLVGEMLGRSLTRVFPSLPAPMDDVALEVEGLTPVGSGGATSFTVRKGEIVGISGLVGSGRTELARAICGIDRPVAVGSIKVNGSSVSIRSPKEAISAGVALLPEDRKSQGLCLRLPISANVSMSHLDEVSSGGLMRRKLERQKVSDLIGRFEIKARSASQPVQDLSGGNQQKALIAKCTFETPIVLIADEPTRGVDVGAKVEIYEFLAQLAATGVGILLISSEIEEILGLSHRVLVMRRGVMVAEFTRQTANEDRIMRAAFGRPEEGVVEQ